MKRTTFATGLFLVLNVLTLSQHKSPAEEEVLAAVGQWEAALPWKQQPDTTAIEKVLASDFTEINQNGQFMDRAQFPKFYSTVVGRVKAGEFTQQSEVSELRVRVYGETALVTGLMTVWGKQGPTLTDFAASFRFSSVWVKRDGRWQEVYYQPTMVAQ